MVGPSPGSADRIAGSHALRVDIYLRRRLLRQKRAKCGKRFLRRICNTPLVVFRDKFSERECPIGVYRVRERRLEIWLQEKLTGRYAFQTFFFWCVHRRANFSGAHMRKAAISLLIVLLAAGVASAATIFNSSSSASDDFCFGYAICQ